MQKAYRRCLYGQLYTQLFNQMNAWNAQALKVCCICASIMCGYIGIRSRSKPAVAAFCGIVHFSASSSYTMMSFDRAHEVVRAMRKLKNEILIATRKLPDRALQAELLKRTVSLRCKGIQMGCFHEAERDSTLIFMHFVESQVIGLLVAF